MKWFWLMLFPECILLETIENIYFNYCIYNTNWAAMSKSSKKLAKFNSKLKEWNGFPGGSDGKEPARTSGDPGLIAGLGRSPGEGNGRRSPGEVFLPKNSHEEWSLVGYSTCGCKYSDMTEGLTFLLSHAMTKWEFIPEMQEWFNLYKSKCDTLYKKN